jgi:hypothetical protein
MPSTSPNSNSIPLAEFHYINDEDYYICPCGGQINGEAAPIIEYINISLCKLLNKRQMYSKSKWQSNRKK